jgi:transposase
MILFAADIALADFTSFDGKNDLAYCNNEAAIDRYVKSFPEGAILALEPTSTYSDLLATKAFEAGHTVYMVQPTWIKAHRRSKRGRAKTDKIDARLIHEYVLENIDNLHPWRPLETRLAELRSLVRQRQSIADDLARARQRYKSLGMEPKLRDSLLKHFEDLKKELDKRILKALAQFPEAKALLSISGIGPLIAATLLVPLMHFEFKSVDSFIAFIGIDPVPKDSGTVNGQRRISKKGDPYLRRAMYMAAFAACRRDAWKARYKHLKDKGLKPKQALIALAKKIATVAFHIFKKQVLFDPAKVALKN